ncbi:helix-turn-helix domain-containing protein [Pelomonas aquatica]|jgi:transcriptional regulator with XRE-family HTH domain|uniref:XRE family transcriptional regulator n=1 Tax=Pelomonas aquatica TaxID=431058 RepID=A0A9X4LIX2_9BURK|nr:helix-turn-helix transcriptional regulator [Pelomonas aquatica]MCY4753573.1 helix-turn-helix transcriptional regulator [Pelomonas aquatica]MDG0863282.1 XRE family transcriptional regulator [Pelomonas aquatica]
MQDDARKRLASRIGSRIARARTNAGMTQDDAAERLEIGKEAVSRMERGVAMPTIDRLYEFAELYGCRVDELLLESSRRDADLGAAIAHRLSGLSQADREMLASLIEQLSEHMRKRKGKQAF